MAVCKELTLVKWFAKMLRRVAERDRIMPDVLHIHYILQFDDRLKSMNKPTSFTTVYQ